MHPASLYRRAKSGDLVHILKDLSPGSSKGFRVFGCLAINQRPITVKDRRFKSHTEVHEKKVSWVWSYRLGSITLEVIF